MIYEAPSKSIVDAWHENIGYCFLGGTLSLYYSRIGFTDSDL